MTLSLVCQMWHLPFTSFHSPDIFAPDLELYSSQMTLFSGLLEVVVVVVLDPFDISLIMKFVLLIFVVDSLCHSLIVECAPLIFYQLSCAFLFHVLNYGSAKKWAVRTDGCDVRL